MKTLHIQDSLLLTNLQKDMDYQTALVRIMNASINGIPARCPTGDIANTLSKIKASITKLSLCNGVMGAKVNDRMAQTCTKCGTCSGYTAKSVTPERTYSSVVKPTSECQQKRHINNDSVTRLRDINAKSVSSSVESSSAGSPSVSATRRESGACIDTVLSSKSITCPLSPPCHTGNREQAQ